jgi:hypothetical protein
MATTVKHTKQEEDLLVESRSKNNKRQGWIARAYEWILKLPVSIVLGVLWLAGVALISVGALALYYFFWLALKGAAGG